MQGVGQRDVFQCLAGAEGTDSYRIHRGRNIHIGEAGTTDERGGRDGRNAFGQRTGSERLATVEDVGAKCGDRGWEHHGGKLVAGVERTAGHTGDGIVHIFNGDGFGDYDVADVCLGIGTASR